MGERILIDIFMPQKAYIHSSPVYMAILQDKKKTWWATKHIHMIKMIEIISTVFSDYGVLKIEMK